MAIRFTPCPVCARHVREGDAACPFCSATSLPPAPLSRAPSTRLSRAAFLALGAAGALAATDCSSSPAPSPPYGTPPFADSGLTEGDSGDAGFAQPLYGAVVPTDAATDDAEPEKEGGFAQPLYGAVAPTPDAGTDDAEPEKEGGFAQPLYGAIAPPYGLPPIDGKG
jgi:hypothetical protein